MDFQELFYLVLGYTFAVLPFAVVMTIAFLLMLLGWGAYHRIQVGLGLVMMTFAIDAAFAGLPSFQLGINTQPTDIVFVVLAVIAILRVLFARDVPPKSIYWILFGVTLAGSFVVGLAKFGTTAGVEFRSTFYFWFGVAYFATFPMDDKRLASVAWWIMAGGVAMLSITVFRWIADAVDWDINVMWRGVGDFVPFRVMRSSEAFLMAEALIVSAFFIARDRSRVHWIWVPFYLATIIVLQHRSVWLAMVAGMISIYVVMPALTRRRLTLPFAGGLALVFAAAVVLLALGKLGGVTESVESQAEAATSLDKGTTGSRIYSWGQLIGDLSPVSAVVGKPYGSGFVRFDSDTAEGKVEWAPHNHYVQTLLREGIIGLALFVLTYAVTMRRLLFIDDFDRSKLPARLLFSILVMAVVMYVPYGPTYDHAIPLGIALSMTAGRPAPAWNRRRNQARPSARVGTSMSNPTPQPDV